MSEICKNCRHWQGTRCSDMGDCYHIIDTIMDTTYLYDRYSNPFIVPYDPHSIRYYLSEQRKRLDVKATLQAFWRHGNNQMMVDVADEEVLDMNDNGVEVKKEMKIPYFRTYKDFKCEYYEETGRHQDT